MALTVTGTSTVTSNFTSTNTAGLLGGGVSYNPNETVTNQYSAGTAANQVDRLYTFTGVIAASTPLVVDLTNWTDLFTGATGQSFARVRHVQIQNLETTAARVLLIGYATTTANAWTSLLSNPGQLTLRPGSVNNTVTGAGVFQFDAPNTTGWAVGPTNRLLQFDPGANPILCKIIIAGCSV